jgi:hypothetical protein
MSQSALVLLLCSLNPIIKDSPKKTMILGRATPDPRLGSAIELSSRDASGLLNLISSGKTLTGQGITPKEAPPALRASLSQHAPVGIKT